MTRRLLSSTLVVAILLGTSPGIVQAGNPPPPASAPAPSPQTAAAAAALLQQILGLLGQNGTPAPGTGGVATSTGAPPTSTTPATPATAAAGSSSLGAILAIASTVLQQFLKNVSGSGTPAGTPQAGSPPGGSAAAQGGSPAPVANRASLFQPNPSGGSSSPSSAPSSAPSNAPSSDTSTTRTPGGATSGLAQSDVDMLCHLVQSEVPDNAPFEGKVAVAAVVLNRVKEKFQGSVSAVINAKYQFSGVKTAQFRTPIKADTLKAVQAAQGGQDPSKGATYYYNPYLVSPHWASTMHETAKIGTTRSTTHRFMHPAKNGPG